jgi:hypothetical protein
VQGRIALALGKPEIRDLWRKELDAACVHWKFDATAVLGGFEQHVGGLQIAMDNSGLMRGVKRPGKLDSQASSPRG